MTTAIIRHPRASADVEIGDVRVKLPTTPDARLLAYVSFAVNGAFVIRECRLVEGNNGPMLSMPSRKAAAHCPGCNYKVVLPARFCGGCGQSVDLRAKGPLHTDVCFPLSQEVRDKVTGLALAAYERARAESYQAATA